MVLLVVLPIVSAGSFDPDSSIDLIRNSAIILASSTKCDDKFYAKKYNLVTSSKLNQSAYQSELAGVTFVLTILEILVCHHNIITEGAVTIALEDKTTMNKSRGD